MCGSRKATRSKQVGDSTMRRQHGNISVDGSWQSNGGYGGRAFEMPAAAPVNGHFSTPHSSAQAPESGSCSPSESPRVLNCEKNCSVPTWCHRRVKPLSVGWHVCRSWPRYLLSILCILVCSEYSEVQHMLRILANPYRRLRIIRTWPCSEGHLTCNRS